MDNEGEVQRSLGRIEGKVDGIVATLLVLGVNDDKLSARITRVEARINRIAGAAALASAIFAVLGKTLFDRLFA